MSEFRVEVIRVGEVTKHPNADALEMTSANGYPVLFRTGQFREGDPAVYVPVDSIVPDLPRWAFLKGDRRIRAKRLRGVFSMGLLTEADASWTEGQDVQQALGIEKYEYPETESSTTPPKTNWSKYDLEGLRRLSRVLIPGEEVIITEKLHGESARYTWQDGRLQIGSHSKWKRPDDPHGCVQVARHYFLEELAAYPGITLYGEVYGGVRKFRYGLKNGDLRLALFDARGSHGAWLRWNDLITLTELVGVPTVPVLYRGPWKEELRELAEGPSTLTKDHVREGIVVQPVAPRFDPLVGGNVKLKFHGEGFLLRGA